MPPRNTREDVKSGDGGSAASMESADEWILAEKYFKEVGDIKEGFSHKLSKKTTTVDGERLEYSYFKFSNGKIFRSCDHLTEPDEKDRRFKQWKYVRSMKKRDGTKFVCKVFINQVPSACEIECINFMGQGVVSGVLNEVIKEKFKVYLVIRYLGDDLYDSEIYKHPYISKVEKALGAVQQLTLLHQKVIHRDVKLKNLCDEKCGRSIDGKDAVTAVSLIDFEFCQPTGKGPYCGFFKQDLGFNDGRCYQVAPESQNHSIWNRITDTFSLGTSFLDLSTPYDGISMLKTLGNDMTSFDPGSRPPLGLVQVILVVDSLFQTYDGLRTVDSNEKFLLDLKGRLEQWNSPVHNGNLAFLMYLVMFNNTDPRKKGLIAAWNDIYKLNKDSQLGVKDWEQLTSCELFRSSTGAVGLPVSSLSFLPSGAVVSLVPPVFVRGGDSPCKYLSIYHSSNPAASNPAASIPAASNSAASNTMASTSAASNSAASNTMASTSAASIRHGYKRDLDKADSSSRKRPKM